MTSSIQVKETKAQRAERLKRAKNPWTAWMRSVASLARGSIRFLPNGSEPTFAGGAFTRRETVPESPVARTAKAVPCNDSWFGFEFQTEFSPPANCVPLQISHIVMPNGIADLTVRQNIQLHWVTIESLPKVLEGLWQVGLNTTGSLRRCSAQHHWMPGRRRRCR